MNGLVQMTIYLWKNMLVLYNLIIDVRSVFQVDSKYYPQVFSDECLFKLAFTHAE